MSSLSGTISMELNLSAMPVSSSPSLNRTPALSVSSFSTDRSNDPTPSSIQHQFLNSHLVEDESSCETGSMRYSPPSPSTHRDFVAPITSLDDTRNGVRSGLEGSINISSTGQSIGLEDRDLSKVTKLRSGSYPSPIGRGISSQVTVGSSNNGKSTNESLSSTHKEDLNPFSQNLSFRREESASNKLSTIHNSFSKTNTDPANNSSSKDNINIHNDLANLSLGNRSSPMDYGKSYSPSHKNLIDPPQKLASPGTIGASLNADSFDKPLDQSSGQTQSSNRELLPQDNDNLNLNRARTYSAPESMNPFLNKKSVPPGNVNINKHGLSDSLPTAWNEVGRNSIDDRVGIKGRNLSTGKMTENRNIFPSMLRERSLLERPDDFKGQISSSIMNNHENSNINAMYNSNQNSTRSNQASSLNFSGNFNSRSEHGEEDSRKLGSTAPDTYNVNRNLNGQYQQSYHMNKGNEGPTFLSRSTSSGPRLEHNMMQGSVSRGSTGETGRHAPGAMTEVFDRMNRNSMMYNEGGNMMGRVNSVNDVRRFMPQMHTPMSHQHPFYNDFHGMDNSTPHIHPQMRSQIQQHNQINQHPFSQMPAQYQHRHQLSNGQRPQSGYNSNMGNDGHRINQYLDEYQLPPQKMSHHQHQTGSDHFQRGNLNSQQFSINQENSSVRRGEGGSLSGNMGHMYMATNSGLPPRHREEYEMPSMSRSVSMPLNRMPGMEGSLHHGNLSGHSQDNSTHGSMKNSGLPLVSPDLGMASHGSNVVLRNQMKGSYNNVRDTIDMHHNQHHDYRNDMSHFTRRHSPLEEPIMNANDGDPYSVGGKPRGSGRHETISGNAVSMHQNGFIPSSSPSRNIENTLGVEMSNGLKGVPKNLNIPHGHVARGSFDSGSYDDGMSSVSHRHKMMVGMSHTQSRPSSLQNSVRSSQGSESSTSLENVPAIISPYPREPQMSNASSSNPAPRLVYNVKFKRTQRSFILGPRAPRDVKIGCYVKVEADRGEDLGFVVSRMPAEKYNSNGRSSYRVSSSSNGGNDSACIGLSGGNAADLKQVIRLATHDEVNHLRVKKEEEDELLKICRAKVKTRGLPMTVCDAEYQFDRNKLTFFFEAEGRIDFRELVRDLFSIYKTRIWMQQLDKNSNGPGSTGTPVNNAVGDGASNIAGGNSVSSVHN